MKEFIVNLYANKYFPIYLGIIIIVLLIAFFIVFFLGKKDQKKIEETQRLNKEDLQKGNVKNITSESNNSVVVQSNIVNDSKNNNVEVKNDNIAITNNTTNENINAEKTPIVNSATQITNNVPNKQIVEVDNTPKVSTPTQSNINNTLQKQTPSSNEVKTSSQSLNDNIIPITSVQNKQVNNPTNNGINNNLTSNINEVKTVNPKDIVMPEVEKTPINFNSEIKKEVVNIQKEVQQNNDDDSYKASSSKLDNSSQNALNRFQNIASSIDKELTELENKQKTFNQKNNNIENNNLNISNVPIKEVPKLVEEKKESNTTVVNNVYSSVYVPNKNVVENKDVQIDNNIDYDETMSIELPKLKEEPILKDEEKDEFKFI